MSPYAALVSGVFGTMGLGCGSLLKPRMRFWTDAVYIANARYRTACIALAVLGMDGKTSFDPSPFMQP